MALEAQRLSVVPRISRLSTLSPLLSQPASSKCFGRRPRLLAISASLLEEREISFTGPEVALVEALVGIQGRGSAASAEQLKEVERAVEVLERQKGVADPVTSNLIEGCWQLIFTRAWNSISHSNLSRGLPQNK
ncbi:hypothetical protein HPP92_008464 [Vanilla planifolia]|uniref:Plastid lipid-associated protein/fibrillin conserved domain-containing protein n=1 Tax=Vanilla planifolia TaxID=51239 RepID=A0A835R2P7_VANPL|nr:hypothetical protein HPP92_008464 [Vanilla planifolia]